MKNSLWYPIMVSQSSRSERIKGPCALEMKKIPVSDRQSRKQKALCKRLLGPSFFLRAVRTFSLEFCHTFKHVCSLGVYYFRLLRRLRTKTWLACILSTDTITVSFRECIPCDDESNNPEYHRQPKRFLMKCQ